MDQKGKKYTVLRVPEHPRRASRVPLTTEQFRREFHQLLSRRRSDDDALMSDGSRCIHASCLTVRRPITTHAGSRRFSDTDTRASEPRHWLPGHSTAQIQTLEVGMIRRDGTVASGGGAELAIQSSAVASPVL